MINLPENCCGLPESQIRNIARDVSSAIEYLHNRHIIHRDLKPENIVLQKADEKVKLDQIVHPCVEHEAASNSYKIHINPSALLCFHIVLVPEMKLFVNSKRYFSLTYI